MARVCRSKSFCYDPASFRLWPEWERGCASRHEREWWLGESGKLIRKQCGGLLTSRHYNRFLYK
jgi:hypothetical protein